MTSQKLSSYISIFEEHFKQRDELRQELNDNPIVPFPKEPYENQVDVMIDLGMPDYNQWGKPQVFIINYKIPYPRIHYLLQDDFVKLMGYPHESRWDYQGIDWLEKMNDNEISGEMLLRCR